MYQIIGVKFKGFNQTTYHYKTNLDFVIDDLAVVKDPNDNLKVVRVTHLAVDVREDINYKWIYGKLEIA